MEQVSIYDVLDKINETFEKLYHNQCLVVGDTVFTEEESNIIIEKSMVILNDPSFKKTYDYVREEYFDKLLFISIIEICKSYSADNINVDINTDTEAGLWAFIKTCFEKYLDYEPNFCFVNNIRTLIKNFSEDEEIYLLDCFKKWYYATLLCHSFSPKSSTFSFFDLMYEKVYLELCEGVYSESDTVFTKIANALKGKFSNTERDENVEIGSKPYSLRAGIKGLAIKYPERMEALIKRTIKCMDNLTNDELLDSSSYYETLMTEWWEDKKQTLGVEKERKKKDRTESVDIKDIKPKYVIDEEVNAVLEIPSFYLENDIYKNPLLEIYDENMDLIKKYEIRTKGNELSMRTVRYLLNLDEECLSSLNYSIKIKHNGNLLYQSNNELKRTFILFRSIKEVTTKICNTGNYLLYIDDFKSLSRKPKEISCISSNFNLYALSASEGECIQTEDRIISFSDKEEEAKCLLNYNEVDGICFKALGKEYKVINGDISVWLCSDVKASDYGIRVELANDPNPKILKLSNLEIYKTSDNYNMYQIPNLETGKPFMVSVFTLVDNKVLDILYAVLFDNFTISYSDYFFYDTKLTGSVSVKDRTLNIIKKFDLSTTEEVSITWDKGEFVLNPPLLTWRIHKEELNKRYVDKIFYKDIINTALISVKIPPQCSGYLFSSDSEIPKDKRQNYKVGEYIYAMSSTNGTEPISLFYKLKYSSGVEEVLKICTFYFKEKFMESPLSISDKGEINWDPTNLFIGPKDSNFDVEIYNETEDKKYPDFNKLKLERKTCKLPVFYEGVHRICIYLKKASWVHNSNPLILEKKIIIGNEKEQKFKNTNLVLEEVLGTEGRTGKVKAANGEEKVIFYFNGNFTLDEIMYECKEGDWNWFSAYIKEIGRRVKFKTDKRGKVSVYFPLRQYFTFNQVMFKRTYGDHDYYSAQIKEIGKEVEFRVMLADVYNQIEIISDVQTLQKITSGYKVSGQSIFCRYKLERSNKNA